MKTLTRILSLVAVLGMPSLAMAGSTFTLTLTPTTDSATAGVATNLSYPAGLKATASGSYSGGPITLSSNSITYAGGAGGTPGITVTFPNNPFGANGTLNTTAGLTIGTFSGTLSGIYTVTIAATNTSNSGKTVTYTLTVGSGPAATPIMVWSPAGVNTNWSTAGNWSPSGPPVSTNDVRLLDLGGGAGPGVADDLVDTTMTIGSLDYGQTNVYHTTVIAPTKTLTVVDANGLVAGTGADNGSSEATVNTITGATGTLIVSNSAATVLVTQPNLGSGTANATLDMSGLGTFKANIARLLVGVDLVIKGDNGTLNLAGTNVITMTPGSTAPQIDIGDNSQSGAIPGSLLNILQLGQTNAFYVDSIAVGRGKAKGGATMLFNSAAIAPTAYFRGTNGNSSAVGTWSIGDANGEKTESSHGTNDFSLGTVNALVNSMFIGLGSSTVGATTTGTGTLLINAGTFNVNSLTLGTSLVTAGSGIVTLTGGTLTVNTNLVLTTGGASASAYVTVSSATLTANNGITVGTGSANLTLNSGTLNATNSTATIGSSSTPLSNLNVTSSTFSLAAQDFVPSIATANLTIGGGPNTINITSVPLLTGFPTQLQLIQYGYNSGTLSGDPTTFVLGTMPTSATPYGGYISNNIANNSVDIVFTNGPFVPALTWDGTPNGNWDVLTTANWRPTSGPDTVYTNTAFTTFNDTLTGTTNVNLTTTVLPGSVTVSNAAETYVFGGTGLISGATSLMKQNTGTLILDNGGANGFSGGVTISGGTLQVGNNDANGNIPAGSLADNASLVYDRVDAVTLPNALSGTGTLTQSGTGMLTLSGTNSAFTGTMVVSNGILQTANSNALGGATSVTVNSGATLDVNGQSLYGAGFVQPVTIAGSGVGGNGALINSGVSQTKVLHILTLTADSTLGGSGDLEIRNSSGNSATADGQLNGAFNLTKTGTNNVSFKGLTIDPGLGNINVQSGSVTITATATAALNSLGNSGSTATVFSNATLTLDTIGTIPGKNFVLTNGGTLKCSGTNTFGDSLILYGPGQNAITVNSGAQFAITTAITGSGGFTKNGGNYLYLNQANTYTGNTVISGGTLALYSGGDGSISSSTNVNIGAGGTLDVSGRSDGTFTLVSGQNLTCGGGGTNAPSVLNGILVASSGSLVSPGGTNGAATLSVISNALLQGSTIMKVSGTNGNDQIDAYAITNTGALLVTNLTSAVTNGQTFQLFIATNGNYSSVALGSVTLPSAAGLTWTNNLAVNGTITAGVVTGPLPMPVITHLSLTGNSLHITGTNGQGSASFTVLTTTNLALPLGQWTPLSTNSFFGDGSFNVTNTVNGAAPQSFFIINY